MLKPKTITFVIAVAVAALLAGLLLSRYWYSGDQQASAPGGILAEPFVDLSGAPKTVGDWHVRLTLVNFWATWCAPCREEIPMFMQLLERYRNRGFRVVGIAIDEVEAVNRFRDEILINYPLLILEDNINAVMSRYGDGMAILPYSVLVDAKGDIFAKKLGAYHREELEALLTNALPSE